MFVFVFVFLFLFLFVCVSVIAGSVQKKEHSRRLKSTHQGEHSREGSTHQATFTSATNAALFTRAVRECVARHPPGTAPPAVFRA